MIPLFPQLRAALTEAWELAPEGATFVVDERMRQSAQGPGGWRNTNLRTTMLKIIRRAGLEPWPRPFHALRSSRQTELAERLPTHVVCAWLGNSEDIARKHYLMVTGEHFREALRTDGQDSAESDARRAATPAQQVAATNCTKPKASTQALDAAIGYAPTCDSGTLDAIGQVGWGGIRTPG